jgi:hypothetical protein
MKFKRIFLKGGIKRMRYSIPALIFSLFRLSNEISSRQPSGEEENKEASSSDEPELKLVKVDHLKLFKCVHELIQLIQQ